MQRAHQTKSDTIKPILAKPSDIVGIQNIKTLTFWPSATLLLLTLIISWQDPQAFVRVATCGYVF